MAAQPSMYARMKAKEQRDENLEIQSLYIWRIPTDQEIFWRHWEGDYVVFNSLSGETHILDITDGKVLRRIMNGPATTEDIRSEIGEFLKVRNDAELACAVDKILHNLEDAGLVEAVI